MTFLFIIPPRREIWILIFTGTFYAFNFVFQGISSEVINDQMKPIIKGKFEERFCAQTMAFGVKGCLELFSQSADFLRDSALYKLIGKHSVATVVKAGKNYSTHATHVVALKYSTMFRKET